MAKDAKGHGSDKRGGGSYQNIDRSAFRPGQHVGYGDGTFRITKLGSGYLATEQKTGESFRGDSLGHVSSQLSDRAAAAELARGNPKSDAVPVHSGASGRLNDRQFAAQNKEANDFQRSRITSGPHYLDPKDPRGRR